MSDHDQPDFVPRIEERLSDLGMSERAASIAAFGHHKGIHNMRGGARSPGLDQFVRLASVLKTSPAYLAFGARDDGRPAPPRSAGRTLPIVGEVAAGQWLDIDTVIDAPRHQGQTFPVDPRWPADAQFAVVVRGTSIDRVAPDGAFLACYDPRAVRYQPQNGELVIVERRRDGGHSLERTAKRYRHNGGVFELWPDSTDPRHKPIVIDPSEEQGEGTSIEIIGIVVAYRHAIATSRPWPE